MLVVVEMWVLRVVWLPLEEYGNSRRHGSLDLSNIFPSKMSRKCAQHQMMHGYMDTPQKAALH